MQFNPTDKAVSLIGDIDFLLFGTSATLNTAYSLTDRTRNVNKSWDEALSILYKADPNYKWDDTSNTDFPLATINLTAGLDHYTILDAAQVIHRVRMKAPSGKFITLTLKNRSEFSDSELEEAGTPRYFYKMGNAIFPIPIPNYSYSLGVELEFQRGGNHFTIADTTKEPGFDSQFHEYLSVGAALRYALANGLNDKITLLTQQKTAIADAMRNHYETRSKENHVSLKLKRPSNRYGL